ncbi:MAG: PepSY domain-containing protein [Chloroflexota bacterium]
MKVKALIGSSMAVGLLGIGILAGSVVGANGASAQTPSATSTPSVTQSAPKPQATITAAITQQAAEAAALAASPGNTIDHTRLGTQNGVAAYDVDFTNGGGVIVDANTGVVITIEAAGMDQGGHKGGRHGGGGADQAALAAKATVTKEQAEAAALAASPGNTIDHSRLGDDNGTIFWDVDFTNGGGVTINANTGAVIATEAAGTDQGGRHGGPAPTPQP